MMDKVFAVTDVWQATQHMTTMTIHIPLSNHAMTALCIMYNVHVIHVGWLVDTTWGLYVISSRATDTDCNAHHIPVVNKGITYRLGPTK